MAEWYRLALAISTTTKADNQTDTVPLIVVAARIWGWKPLRTACCHPDPVVRLGTRLGMLGLWLGLLALARTGVHHVARFFHSAEQARGGDPTGWIGERGLAVQRVRG